MPQVQLDQTNQSNEPSLLKVEHLVVNFSSQQGLFRSPAREFRAVDDVSFSLRESEFVSLVGESGSGKTTVARCISALVSPSGGKIDFNGIDVTRLSGKSIRDYRRNVQMVFQDPFGSLNHRLTVYQTLATPIIHLVGEKKKSAILDRVFKLLEEVGLEPERLIHRLPHQLSGGQMQRISIARALAAEPKLLVADEPITMLDAAQRLNVLSLLSRLKSRFKLTILMITHDLASAKITSERTLVMYRGRIVESGPTKQLLERPFHPYVKEILSATPKLSAPVEDFFNVSLIRNKSDQRSQSGCIYRDRCAYAAEVCKTDPKLEEKSSSRYCACHLPLNH